MFETIRLYTCFALTNAGEGRLEQQQLRQRRPHRQHRKAIQR